MDLNEMEQEDVLLVSDPYPLLHYLGPDNI
jgi:hypothetical protein